MQRRIENVKIYTEQGRFVPGAIITEGAFVQRILLEEAHKGERSCEDGTAEVIDGGGCYCIPGMIDIHLHGCRGQDFCDGTREALETSASWELSVGVTAMAPAVMTLPTETLESVLAGAAAYRKEQQEGRTVPGADLVGINMEGPFISPVKKGAQDARYIVPCDVDLYRRFQDAAGGLIRFVGIAPEESRGAESFIRKVKEDAVVALSHTNADYDTALAAFTAGARHVVHLFNAMSPCTHRAPGVVGAAADSLHVDAEMICDGVHIHPAMVRGALKMLGADRVCFVSDSMRATGLSDGQYTLGGLAVEVRGKRAVLASDGALAGSVTSLPDCVRTAVSEMGVPLETAVACATANPAKSLGQWALRGSLTPGKLADLVLWNGRMELQAVMKSGEWILR